ncbi:MAG: UvrB/UvrC motif-containing protein [Phycisphaerae bacterium]
MASHDLRRILAGWDYEPNQITVRKVAGDDGSVKIQMRLPLGVLQMEDAGRPDGARPFGFDSLLDYHEHRSQEHVRKNGTALGFELTPEECRALRDESEMYYHRYLAEFVLEEFEGVAKDTARNLGIVDLCRRYAREESDRVCLEQYRPYLIMMNTRAQTHLALRNGALKTALARVDAGMGAIHELLVDVGQEDAFEELTEVSILLALRGEIAARLPADPVERIEREIEKAVREERYEDAAALRDRMEGLLAKRSAPAPKKRKK